MKRFVFVLTVAASLACCGTAHAQSFGGFPSGGLFSPGDLLNGLSSTPPALASPSAAFGSSAQSPFGSLGGLLGGSSGASTSSPFSSFFGSLLGGSTAAPAAPAASPLTGLFSGFTAQPAAPAASSNPFSSLLGSVPQLLNGFSGTSAPGASSAGGLFNLSSLGNFGQIAQGFQSLFSLF